MSKLKIFLTILFFTSLIFNTDSKIIRKNTLRSTHDSLQKLIQISTRIQNISTTINKNSTENEPKISQKVIISNSSFINLKIKNKEPNVIFKIKILSKSFNF